MSQAQTHTHPHPLPVSGRLQLRAPWARGLPGQGGAASTVQAWGAAAGGDVAADATAGGGEGGGSGHGEPRGTPNLQAGETQTGMWVAVVILKDAHTHTGLTRSSLTTVSNNSSFPLSQGWKYLKPFGKKQNSLTTLTRLLTPHTCIHLPRQSTPVVTQAKPCRPGSAAASSAAPSLVSSAQRKEP